MQFKFKAIKSTGEQYESIRDSADKFSLYSELKAEGDTLISTTEVSYKANWLDTIPLFNGVPEHQKIIFTKNLGYMLAAGLSLSKSLTVLEKQIASKKMKEVIASLGLEIKKGKSFSESAKLYPTIFSNLFVSMVKAGEESGKLSESLEIVAEQMEQTYKLKSSIRGAMIYPSVILSVMILIAILMLIFVIPTISSTFEGMGVQLPLITQVIIDTSGLLIHHIFLSLGAIFGTIIGVYLFYLSKPGKAFMDFFFLKLPVVGELIRETNAARLSRTISSLLSSGVAFGEALTITSEVIGNRYFKIILKEAQVKVEKGETLSSVFMRYTNICPVFVPEMMSVGEETGQLPDMLKEVASFYENSVNQQTKDISTIIEPVLLVVIGLAVGTFALAIITPIYSVMGNLSS